MNRAAALFTLSPLVAVGACFDPTFDNPTCGPNGECPSGFTCEQSVCREMVSGVDAPGGSDATDSADDAPIDAPGDGLTDAPPIDAAVMCPNGEVQSPLDPHRCFFKLPGSQPWQGARTSCMSAGADLADILSQAENFALSSLFQGENQGLWLGGSDMIIEMDWRWVHDNSSPPYFEWGPGEPNDQPIPADCMRIDQSGQWFDSNCNDARRALCLRRI